uniref:L,D-transpeptidase family protein n=1 Tax=Myxococcus sp. AB025B TaxID=2562794 RepID=UPI001E39248D
FPPDTDPLLAPSSLGTHLPRASGNSVEPAPRQVSSIPVTRRPSHGIGTSQIEDTAVRAGGTRADLTGSTSRQGLPPDPVTRATPWLGGHARAAEVSEPDAYSRTVALVEPRPTLSASLADAMAPMAPELPMASSFASAKSLVPLEPSLALSASPADAQARASLEPKPTLAVSASLADAQARASRVSADGFDATKPVTSSLGHQLDTTAGAVSGWGLSSWTPSPSPLGNTRFTNVVQLSPVASGQEVLGPGSRGEGIRAVQGALLEMGFALHGGADGQFGPQTVRALRNFQVHASRTLPGVKVTGALDATTLKALDSLAPAPGARGQSRGIPPAVYEGQPVRVIVALREHRTFLYDAEGRLVDIFPNASGTQATPTRAGLKVVRSRLDQAAAEAAGARLWNDKHVFGTRILDLSWADGRHSAEELHGTNAPALLGMDVSHGCIRHSNEAIIVLHDALSAGDRVAIVEHVNDPHLGAAAPVPVS